uniref:MEIS N-terminal domain-containing protein n=1 Tax=Anopheles atroparvus TaxID=41427 RepID=A0A182ILA6_ANOAO
MQENSVTAVPVSGVTASGLGSAVGATGILGNNALNASNSSNSSTGSNSNGSSSNNGPPPGSGPVVTSTAAGSSSSTTISPHGLSDIDQAQFEADKRAVYKHPLFSLLALLLEKCEQATQGYIPSSSSASSPNGSTNNGTSDGDSFSRDIQAFVQLLEKEKRPLLTNNSELDGLMIKALQVLRIHLLELEKVQELCRDFCTRYIACLRSKMQSENLLRSDYALEHNNNLSNSNSPINSPEQDLSGSAQGYYQNADYLQGSDTSEYSNMQAVVANLADLPQPVSPNSVAIGASVHEIGPEESTNQAASLSPCGSSDELDSELDSPGGDGDSSSGKRQKRGILPKHATSVMRAWLFQHLVVNNWFINARRRILLPMLENASDNSGD